MYLNLLKELNQNHILEAYQHASEEERTKFNAQVQRIEKSYPGGLKTYYHNALVLLKESAEGINPYANYEVGIPKGVMVSEKNLEAWENYEKKGLQQLKHSGFVLVAGGLGERLGYPGIKVSIPTELLTEKCFLQFYCEYIQAFQKKFCNGSKIPLAIMTSDDTNAKTVELLHKNKFFGLSEDQVTILNQQKVPALINNEAHFSLINGKLQLETKPHGHGDVHTLLHMSGTAKKWLKEGRKWLVVFQDTNPFSLRSFPLLLGISSSNDFDFNSLAVPRKPGEAVGAITSLVHKETKKTLTINIEYNQVQSLFKQSGGQPTNQLGYSIFPGNTNCFCIKLDSYNEVLERTQGLISEFINPKYADQTKTKFKSSTRLECMMQDYPKLLPNCDKVGFSDVPRGYCFTTLKNDLASANTKQKQGLNGQGAGSCQADIYFNNRHLLRLCGASIEESKLQPAGGSDLPLFPMISLSPSFSTCLTELRQKVKHLKVHPRSSLVVQSDCVLDNVEVDGHVVIKAQGNINLNFEEKNYTEIVGLGENQPDYLKIRGYKFKARL